MQYEWDPLPFETMKKWEPEENDDAILNRYKGLELPVPAAKEPHFRARGIHCRRKDQDDHNIYVTFRVEDAALWVRLISGLLRTCWKSMSMPPVNGQPSGFRESASFLPILSLLLGFRPIKALLTQTSLGKAFRRKHKLKAEAHDQSGEADADVMNSEDQLTGDAVESIEEIVDEDINEEDRNSPDDIHRGGLLVFRFIETLVAPLRALSHLSQLPFPPDPTVIVTLVTLAPPQRAERVIRQDLLDQVRKELKEKVIGKLGDPRDKDILPTATDWIDRHFTKKAEKPRKLCSFIGNAHAEAGLMALSYHSPNLMMSRPESLPIGVSKKCCWTCWKLSSLLHRGPSPQKFDLPGSHGTIYAWSPPKFGIPRTVLGSLCDELYGKAVEAAISDAYDRKSQASSPASERNVKETFMFDEFVEEYDDDDE